VRAYRNAARSIGDLGSDVATLMQRGTALTDIPGIGEDLAKKIQEIIETGKCEFLERLHEEIPPAIRELLKIPGLGPKRVKLLWHALHIHSLEQLLQAAQDGQIRQLRGFGEKIEQKIIETAQARLSRARRFKHAVAAPYAEALTRALRKVAGVDQVTVAGSFRRMRETVGDLDIVVTAESPEAVMDRFVTDKEVKEVLAHGPTRSSVLLKFGLQVDLRVVPKESYGAALVYFTGSKAHNIAIRHIAQNKGLKLNEYGVFEDDKRIAGETEESVYNAIGLRWIAPELREDSGEIQAALAGEAAKKSTSSVPGRK
jgi:DNA polymerase (family X)